MRISKENTCARIIYFSVFIAFLCAFCSLSCNVFADSSGAVQLIGVRIAENGKSEFYQMGTNAKFIPRAFGGSNSVSLTLDQTIASQSAIASSCATASFETATNFPVGANPFGVALDDFNGDGKLDLAVANYTSNDVSILLGNGVGSLGTPGNFTAGGNPISVAVSDFNGDGKRDLAVANNTSSNVSILLGDGAGSFGTATNFAVGSDTYSVAVGDFNGDGKMDLATASYGNSNVSILLGNGVGSFGPATNFAVHTNAISVTPGDFNGDGRLDLVVANYTSNDVSILLGNGAGSFGNPSNFGVGSRPYSTAVGDFNGDGNLDVVTANSQSSNVSILLGNGAGSFGVATNFGDAGSSPHSVAINDFNADGKLDLAVANFSDNVSIFLGDGTGSFGSATNLATHSSPIWVAAGDFNGDGKLDLAVTNYGSNDASILLNNCTPACPLITLNDKLPDGAPTATYAGNSVIASGGTAPYTYAITSGTLPTGLTLNSDGTVSGIPTTVGTFNFAITAHDENGCAGRRDYTIMIREYCATPSFGTAANFGTFAFPFSIAVSDLNGDGNLDLAVANINGNNVSILLGNGGGSFGTTTNFGAGSNPYSLAVGDFNGDTKPDLAVANFTSNNVSILLGNGTGSFATATNFSVASNPISVAVGDLNGDGKLDLTVANYGSNNASILLGNGAGAFTLSANYNAGTHPYSNALGDFNGDTKLDLVIVNSGSNNVSVLMGDSSGSFGTATNFGTGSAPLFVALGDLNGDGNLDIATANQNSNNISILLGDGLGSFATAGNFDAGTTPYSVAIGDFNGDGKLDLAAANFNSANVSILLGDGTGSFGTPTNFGAGSGAAKVAVNDFNGDGKLDLAVTNINSNNISILLDNCTACPVITLDDTLPDGTVGDSYVGNTIVAGGGTTPYSYTVTSGALPTGLTLNPNGSISGTPTTVGIFNFDVTATDANGCTGSHNYTVAISALIVITLDDTLPDGSVGTAYSGNSVTASGGTGPYNYAITSGALPTGLTLNSGGSISGTPTAAGTFNFDVTATDANSATGSLSYAVVITGCPVIALSPATLPDGTVDASYAGNRISASSSSNPNQSLFQAFWTPGPFLFETSGWSLQFEQMGAGLDQWQTSFDATMDFRDFPELGQSFVPTQPTVTSVRFFVDSFPFGWCDSAHGDCGIVRIPVALRNDVNGSDLAVATLEMTGLGQAEATFSNPVAVVSGNTYYFVLEGDEIYSNGTSLALRATSGSASYTYAVTDGLFPTGLTLNANGTISGVPITAGKFTFTVTAAHANGCTGTRDYTINIATGIVDADGDTIPDATDNCPTISNTGQEDADGDDIGDVCDPTPYVSLTINDVSLNETNSGTVNAVFTVTLSAPSTIDLTVHYSTTNGTATGGSDYSSVSNNLTIPANTNTGTIVVPVSGDTVREPNETFFVNLSNPVNATIADSQGIGTIQNDDVVPALSVDDVSIVEGNSGTKSVTFTVSLSAATTTSVTVSYATADGSATAPSDYTSKTGTVTIAAGTISKVFGVSMKGDGIEEPNETFFVNLSNPVNATIADPQGIGTIQNDDITPAVSINDVSVLEGNSGTPAATFTVTLSAATTISTTVSYATANGSATAPADYATKTGTVTIAAGTTSKTFSIALKGDGIEEPDETFFVNLSNPVNATIADSQGIGTIRNDDITPAVSINDVSIVEGNSGSQSVTFTVSLSAATTISTTVSYATADGSATAAADYTSKTGTVTIAAGTTSKTLTIAVKGDVIHEPLTENFYVNLFNPVNLTIADGQGMCTITDND